MKAHAKEALPQHINQPSKGSAVS